MVFSANNGEKSTGKAGYPLKRDGNSNKWIFNRIRSYIPRLIVLIIIAIILKVKLHKEKKAEKGIDLPGADELDRAIMEHQELSELDEFGEFEDKTMDEFNNDTDSAIDNNYDNQNLTNDYYDNTNYIEDIAKSRKNESNLDLDYPDDLNYQEYQDYPEEKSDKILKKKGKGKHF